MEKIKKAVVYPPLEEKINVISHAIGLLLSVLALILLIVYSSTYGNAWHIVSAIIFGLSLITLYSASTIYHSTKDPIIRQRLRIFDHAAIYVLIAGTYTPITLVVLNGTTGWILFALVWGMALIGIILKLFFTGRYNLLSTIMYVAMGWLVVFAVNPLIESLDPAGLYWLAAGGIFYTVGAFLYSRKSLAFNHAIFHIFVLFGSFCHFIAVFYYVLPPSL